MTTSETASIFYTTTGGFGIQNKKFRDFFSKIEIRKMSEAMMLTLFKKIYETLTAYFSLVESFVLF